MKIFVTLLLLSGALLSCNGDKRGSKAPLEYRGRTAESSKWINKIVSYTPAAGQFINTSLGSIKAAEGIVGQRGIVSLGGYGGRIVFAFDHSVVNEIGTDFVIHGNAFEGSSEPGIVMVSADANKNGVADDVWYELKGSEYEKQTKNYEITYTKPAQTTVALDVEWIDNKGEKGVVNATSFHNQCYFPLFLEGDPHKLTFAGARLANNGTINPINNEWFMKAYSGGYVDNFTLEYPKAVNGDEETKMSNKFDLSDAVDANSAPVKLVAVDYIMVYTAVNQVCGAVGEVSTEVCGAISLTKVNQ